MMDKSLKIIFFTVISLLLIPLIAMQFTDEVNWSPMDFLIAAVLLLGTGFLVDLVIRKTKNLKYRIVIMIVIIIVFILIWAELAVGVFGTPFSGS